MVSINQNTKINIINKINDILNIDDPNWLNLEKEIRIKIIHNLCDLNKLNFAYSFIQYFASTNPSGYILYVLFL